MSDIEYFVRDELLDILTTEYEMLDEKMSELDNVFFFGIFAAKPENFRFLPGEQLAIMEISSYAKDIIDEKNIFADLKRGRTSRMHTIHLPIGTFFGRGNTKNVLAPVTTQQLRDNLIPKLKNLILWVNPQLNFEENIAKMEIEVHNRDNKVTATVKCLFCLSSGEKEKKYIQYDVPPNSSIGYWNPTNFKRHLRAKHKNNGLESGLPATKSNTSVTPKSAIGKTNSKDLSGNNNTSTTNALTNQSMDSSIVYAAVDSSINSSTNSGDYSNAGKLTNTKVKHRKASIVKSATNVTKNPSRKNYVSKFNATKPSSVITPKSTTISKISPKITSANVQKKNTFTQPSSIVSTINPSSDSNISCDSSVGASTSKQVLLDKSLVITSTPKSTNLSYIQSLEDNIYQQISEQNLHLLQSSITHKIRKYKMNFKLRNEMLVLKVLKIDRYGDCLFSSVWQQISGCKPNTDDHQDETNELRSQTITYLKDNIEKVKFMIKGRILENREANSDKSAIVTEADCLHFVTNQLSKSGFWGGIESMFAISKLHKINILVFSESNSFYFPIGFNSEFQKTKMIAFRLAKNSKNERNHYDGVADIDQADLFDCAKYLASISK